MFGGSPSQMFGASPVKFPTLPEGFFSGGRSNPIQVQQEKTDWLIEYNLPQNETTPGALKDYEEEDCGSGTEADNEETEEEGDYYDEYDEDRENRFFMTMPMMAQGTWK